MRKLGVVLLTLGLVVLALPALAADNASHTINFEVQAINEIAVSLASVSLVVNSATAGAQPDADTDATSFYAITTNGTNKRIQAKLDTAMPADTTLVVNVEVPSVGSSAGDVTLTATDQDVVTGITEVADAASGITYTLDATVAAGIIGASSRTVTFTIIDGV